MAHAGRICHAVWHICIMCCVCMCMWCLRLPHCLLVEHACSRSRDSLKWVMTHYHTLHQEMKSWDLAIVTVVACACLCVHAGYNSWTTTSWVHYVSIQVAETHLLNNIIWDFLSSIKDETVWNYIISYWGYPVNEFNSVRLGKSLYLIDMVPIDKIGTMTLGITWQK